MVEWIKCVPFVGTLVSAAETGKAFAEGNGRKGLLKLGETAVVGTMDALTVFTLRTSAIAATAVKTGTKVGISAFVKNVAAATAFRAVGNKFTDEVRESVESGGGGSGDKSWKKEKSTHEMDLDNEGSPITRVVTDSYGRISELCAEIKKHHIRKGERIGAGYSDEVNDHVRTLNMIRGDDVGHIIGWCIGGPYNYVYNFFPQNPKSNKKFSHELELKIKQFLESYPKGRVYFRVDFYNNGSNRRPTGMDYYVSFWKDDHNCCDEYYDFHLYNDDRAKCSKTEIRRMYDIEYIKRNWFKKYRNP